MSTALQALTYRHSGRRAIIVDLALSVAGSQLIATVLPNVRGYMYWRHDEVFDSRACLQADKDQRALLYESIRGHIVTLRGCKTGSKVIWLLYVSRLSPATRPLTRGLQ